ncbi:MAG: sporulation protein YabP [Oscillospiraceae bacterium]|jgi:sporulation protein YabP|nr:sporulation protein YabP [Oscillospiraceae bacterium]
MYDDRGTHAAAPHNVILEGRARLSISGVEDVESFDESTVVLYTGHGLLTVRGASLRVDRLSIEGGELNIEGTVDALQYQDEQPSGGGGFWSRLFR